MTRVFFTGLEAGSLDIFDRVSVLSVPTISAVQARTGVYSMYCFTGEFAESVLGSGAASELFLRIGLYYTGGWGVVDDRTFCTLYSASVPLLSFQIRQADNVILVRLGDYNGALLASGGIVPLNSWSCIELRVLIADVGGIVQVRVDGVQVIDFTGDTEVGIETIIYKIHWAAPGDAGIPALHSCHGYYDDLAVNNPYGIRNNSWLGLGGIVGLLPDGAGNYTQLTPSAGANWQCVDEVPPDDDASYVENAIINQRDTYRMEDLTITPGKVADIAAVQWLCRAYNTETQGGNFARLIRLGGVNYQGDDIGYDKSYDYHPEIIEVSPATMQNWTGDEVNALEAGVVVR